MRHLEKFLSWSTWLFSSKVLFTSSFASSRPPSVRWIARANTIKHDRSFTRLFLPFTDSPGFTHLRFQKSRHTNLVRNSGCFAIPALRLLFFFLLMLHRESERTDHILTDQTRRRESEFSVSNIVISDLGQTSAKGPTQCMPPSLRQRRRHAPWQEYHDQRASGKSRSEIRF